MAVWSSTLRALGQNIIQFRGSAARKFPNNVTIRCMSSHGPRVFPLTPSRWQWNKTKDLVHFYFMLGIIPVTLIVTGAYIFVGPATLQEIPEGYVPKHWEYYRNPISRFMSRYIFSSHQQEYEKTLHAVWEEGEKVKILALEKKIKDYMAQNRDYQAYYYRPSIAKYYRYSRDIHQELEEIQGD